MIEDQFIALTDICMKAPIYVDPKKVSAIRPFFNYEEDAHNVVGSILIVDGQLIHIKEHPKAARDYIEKHIEKLITKGRKKI